ncbi:MAG: elongation factor P [Candidatus Nealsonbacteria bacterium]
MISYSELKKGLRIILNKEPHEILEARPLFKGRGHSVLQAKIKNLITGNIISQTFHPSDVFEEAELKKLQTKFLYAHRSQYFFSEIDQPAKRFNLTQEQIGYQAQFLKPRQIVETLIYKEKIVNISLPIKVHLKVVEAPPGVRAGRAEAGTKQVTLETGVKISVPIFIKEGDIIEVNTQSGEYVRRIE